MVSVDSFITLSDLSESFLLSGMPGETVTLRDAVSYTVESNYGDGYEVRVTPETEVLFPQDTATNPDTIPIEALEYDDDTSPNGFFPLMFGGLSPVHYFQRTRSAQGGDHLTTHYRMTIPFVAADTYTVTLDYIAISLYR